MCESHPPGGRGSQAGPGRGKATTLVAVAAAHPGRGSGAWPRGGPACAPSLDADLTLGARGLGEAGAACRRPTARVRLHVEPSPVSSGPSARVQEAMGVVPLAHLSPSGVEMGRLSAAGQGGSEAHPIAGSWFLGAPGPDPARPHSAGPEGTTGQGCEEGCERARVGDCCTHAYPAAGWWPRGICQEDGTASEWPLSPLLPLLRPW